MHRDGKEKDVKWKETEGERRARVAEGDTIGLQVDFGRDTVTAFKNGRRLGLLVNGLSRVLGAGPLKQDGW